MTEYFDPEGVFQKVVIFNNKGQVLLLQASEKYGEKAGTWDLPGGKVNEGERLDVSISREVEEETGMILDQIYPVDADIVKFSDGKTRIGIIYLAHADMNVRLSYEHVRFEWVSTKDVKNKLFSFNAAPLWIEKAEKIREMTK